MSTIFETMRAEGLTTLLIDYDYKTGRAYLNASEDWDKGVSFSGLAKDFNYRSALNEERRSLNTSECLELFEKSGAGEMLKSLLDRMKAGKHEKLSLFYHAGLDLKIAAAEHNTVRGLKNRSHAISCGGIRRHLKDVSELYLIEDALNLSRAMSFKNVAAEIPFGGCKITIQGEDISSDEALGFIAYAVDRCRVVTAPDMNLKPEISDTMAEKGYSSNFVGGLKSVTGATGKPTAYGIYLSMKEAVRFREGTDSLAGKSILLIGLGNVGRSVAEYVLAEGALLSVSDIDMDKVEKLRSEHRDHKIDFVPPEEALKTEADIISPCAMGGLFTPETIDALKCKYIWGSANNQLVAANKEEEIALAERIAARGILYEAEWWHNTAGVMCMAEEYLNEATPEDVLRRVERIIPRSVEENLKEAERLGITPTENCYRLAEKELYR